MAQTPVQVTTESPVKWSDGTPFNGYIALIASLPQADGSSWSKVALRDTYPQLRLPTRIKVPIREGVVDSSTWVFKTESIVPPQIKYSAFWYDSTDRLIAIGQLLFGITTSPCYLTPPVLPVGTAATVPLQPQDVPESGSSLMIYGAPKRENLTGTKNSINTTFTLSSVPSLVMVMWNALVLDEGVGYTRTGSTITMAVAPASGDTLEAILW